MQLRQTFSIHLPVELYQELLKRVGKGKINGFIKQTLEEKLKHEKNCLGWAYKECYTNNPHLLAESKLWEQAQNEDWLSHLKPKATKKKHVRT